MAVLQDILAQAVKSGASDIHLTVGSPPACRIDGQIRFVGEVALTPKDTMDFLDEMMSEEQKASFLKSGDFDMALGIPGLGRFRANVLRQRGSIGLIFRYVKGTILDFEKLRLPEAMNTIAEARRGLVLITGTSGCGKSSTLAAIVDRINRTRHDHIITLEDPIEFLHSNRNCIVTQREISIDTKDFAVALRAAMREDPDVILIGEMRDPDTFGAAISAAETGHLVLSTMHTSDAMLTIERIMDMFPSNQHEQIRSQVALQLKACVAQRLVPTSDGKGRAAAVEIMFNSPAIAQLIRENDIEQFPKAIAAGSEEGMQTFNMSLLGLVKEKVIGEEDAMLSSDNPEELAMNFKGIFLS